MLQCNLLRLVWTRIVLDEAHNIKNNKSLTAMAVCRLRALHRWALTGTPIQNQLLDMYSLLRYRQSYDVRKQSVPVNPAMSIPRMDYSSCVVQRITKCFPEWWIIQINNSLSPCNNNTVQGNSNPSFRNSTRKWTTETGSIHPTDFDQILCQELHFRET